MSQSLRPSTVADWLTISRLAAAPWVVVAAFVEWRAVVVALLAFGYATDLADGAIARRTGTASARGARLDSLTDFVFIGAICVSIPLLVPERVRAEWPLVVVLGVSYFVPMLVGLVKFRRLTSYHTALSRVAFVSVAVGVAVWLSMDTTVMLQVAAAILLISAVEEVAITCMLDVPTSDVHDFRRLLRRQRLSDQADHGSSSSGQTSTTFLP